MKLQYWTETNMPCAFFFPFIFPCLELAIFTWSLVSPLVGQQAFQTLGKWKRETEYLEEYQSFNLLSWKESCMGSLGALKLRGPDRSVFTGRDFRGDFKPSSDTIVIKENWMSWNFAPQGIWLWPHCLRVVSPGRFECQGHQLQEACKNQT